MSQRARGARARRAGAGAGAGGAHGAGALAHEHGLDEVAILAAERLVDQLEGADRSVRMWCEAYQLWNQTTCSSKSARLFSDAHQAHIVRSMQYAACVQSPAQAQLCMALVTSLSLMTFFARKPSSAVMSTLHFESITRARSAWGSW